MLRRSVWGTDFHRCAACVELCGWVHHDTAYVITTLHICIIENMCRDAGVGGAAEFNEPAHGRRPRHWPRHRVAAAGQSA